ncbi:hypothetical protein V6N13_028075 [Hibiscus sabdariffa]|uniref:Uncharacterized protein n=1 Tax=Hibiscus sabdariffa TaxID=183260 RepID=A0ABR2B0X3_9ROSI
MDRQHRKKAKTSGTGSGSCSEEVSSIEWEFINMSEQEEDLIFRMYKLVGDNVGCVMAISKKLLAKSIYLVLFLYLVVGEAWVTIAVFMVNLRTTTANLWGLIAGRIPGRKAEDIERFWIMRHGEIFASRRRDQQN